MAAYDVNMVGDAEVGKTKLIERFMHNTYTDLRAATPRGGEVRSKEMIMNNRDRVVINIMDSAGLEDSTMPNLYRKMDAVFVVYNIMSEKSFRSVPTKWAREIEGFAPANVEVTLVGTRSDMSHIREVTVSAGLMQARHRGWEFMETSALSGANVQEVFRDIVSIIYKKQVPSKPKPSTFPEPRPIDGDHREGPCSKCQIL